MSVVMISNSYISRLVVKLKSWTAEHSPLCLV